MLLPLLSQLPPSPLLLLPPSPLSLLPLLSLSMLPLLSLTMLPPLLSLSTKLPNKLLLPLLSSMSEPRFTTRSTTAVSHHIINHHPQVGGFVAPGYAALPLAAAPVAVAAAAPAVAEE